MCVCVCVCVFQHNFGTAGAISTKLGTHMAICMYKNLMYVYIYIYILYLLSIIFRWGMMWEASTGYKSLPR
jgi:hypothetical protein